jgi:TIR domain/inactive STAND
MRRYVFISHADPDKTRIRPVVEGLLDAAIDLWIDQPEMLGLGKRHLSCGRISSGADWQDEIVSGLESSACVLFFLSRAANDRARSDYLIREFEHGKANGKLIIAQIDQLDHWEINPFYRIRQTIDLVPFLTNPIDALGTTKFEVLLNQVRRYIPPVHVGQTSRAATFSGVLGRAPRLLPYLADRHEQNQRITRIVQNHIDSSFKAPITFLLIGRVDQCVDSFIEQVENITLPSLLVSNSLVPQVVSRDLQWPCSGSRSIEALDDDDIGEYVTDLMSQIRIELELKTSSPDQMISQRIAGMQASCCFHLNTSAEDWYGPQAKVCERWLKWWQDLDLGSVTHPTILIISITYEVLGAFWLLKARPLERTRQSIVSLGQLSSFKGNVHVLPELGNISYEDIERWVRDHAQYLDREVLSSRVRREFSSAFGRRRRLPMSEIAAIVKAALAEMAPQT